MPRKRPVPPDVLAAAPSGLWSGLVPAPAPRRSRPRRLRVVALVGGAELAMPGSSGLLRRVAVDTPEALVRGMARSLPRLSRARGKILPEHPTIVDAVRGLSPRDVLLLVRFGAAGDIVQLRAVVAVVRRRLGRACPRLWLKTRRSYVALARGAGRWPFDRVLASWPPLRDVARVLPLDSVLERDHSGLPEAQRHRVALFWDVLGVPGV